MNAGGDVSESVKPPPTPAASRSAASSAQHVTVGVVLLALGPFAFGYLLSYFFRSVNAVVAPDLVKELGVSPAQLGLLTAAYLAAFAAFQLPLGVLLDRYGPRRVQAALLSVAALGALLFALSTSVAGLTAARALIGLGFAGGLMAGFKAVVLWVDADRRPLANACVMSTGAVGLFIAATPTEFAIQAIGWRNMFFVLTGITLGAALLVLVCVPERRADASQDGLGTQILQIGQILSDRAFWSLAPLLATTAGSQIAIQTLWAGPWLRDVAELSRAEAAAYLSLIAIAFLVGILLSGAAADWFIRRGVGVLSVMFGFLALYLASQLAIVIGLADPIALAVAWFVFGMSGQVAVLAYPWFSTHFGAQLTGRAHTTINLLVFALAFVLQYAIGLIIEQFVPRAEGGYGPEAYQAAFGAVLALQVVSAIWLMATARHLRKPAAV
jgi:MFS family permease